MFFFLAKTVGFIAQTPNLLIVLLLLGVIMTWTRYRRAGRTLAAFAAVCLGLILFSPLANIVVRPLEDRFPQPALSAPPTGIVVLGGAMNESITRLRGQVSLNEAAERLTMAVALARRYPGARLVFSGGSGRLQPDEMTESDVAKKFWTEMGVPPERIELENRSRDTYENAAFTKELVRPKPGERWLLVTSALHMPRSVGIFRKIGFDVTPFPVDYQTMGTGADYANFMLGARGLVVLDSASHEYIGLVAYWLTGKSSALFPGP